MKIKVYKAKERGYADYGWLQAKYSFSFANYYHPTRINFGTLRVLNDDTIKGGMGFEKHPHNNMEIITIPLKGTLAHKDSMSDKWISLESGEVQVMSAGKGIMHAEKNNSDTDLLSLFQIWIIPDEQEVEPSYNQLKFKPEDRKDKLQILVTSYADKKVNSLKINQDAKISIIDLSKNKIFDYKLMSVNHGVYLMLISGDVTIDNHRLYKRDAAGIYESSRFSVRANQNAELLFIEVPMN